MNYRHPHAAILIFTKAPVAGEVKTRLVPPLTSQQAALLHQKLVHHTLRMATRQPIAPVILYCSPDLQHPFFQTCLQSYPITLQQQHGEDLGARMLQALNIQLQAHRYVILIGTDSPTMTQEYLQEAFQRLKSGSDVVIGPAMDGGYVLIGMKTPYVELFTDLPWGTDAVFALTMDKAMQAGLQVSLLDNMVDIDRPEDLPYITALHQAD